ncbi:RNA methyltransferase [Candidatus Saccharibacteria bacterium]|nr:RNA methyltransferase [Candidatus Saccharibacteria bacterium]
MPELVYLTSLQNPRLKALVAQRRHKQREARGTILIEGRAELELVLTHGLVPKSVYYAPDMMAPESSQRLLELVTDATEHVVLSPEAFAKVSYRDSPDGWLGEFASPVLPLSKLKIGSLPLVIVAEGIEKPGNLGALLRTADAVGADGVVAASEITDWLNPNVVRASKGTVMTLPVASCSTSELVTWAHGHGLKIVVATPEAEANYTEVNLAQPIAIVVGAEHSGVSEELKAAADITVSIPMTGTIDSLNAATAGALLAYEALRQRA